MSKQVYPVRNLTGNLSHGDFMAQRTEQDILTRDQVANINRLLARIDDSKNLCDKLGTCGVDMQERLAILEQQRESLATMKSNFAPSSK